jgi:Spy/CpxP family protein refolding chaperone
MFLLQTRLHLTPDQAAKIKAAMDADAQAHRTLMQQAFRNNGQVDPAAAAKADTLDQTLATVLTPEQQTAYQQVQADEEASRADMAATMQVDQMAPLLQLSDSQKDQVVQALYQVQASAPDPASLLTNPNAASIVTAQAQATQAALAKVLTPDQMALYQQEAQAMPQFGFGRRGGGNGGGANASGAANPPPTPPAQ